MGKRWTALIIMLLSLMVLNAASSVGGIPVRPDLFYSEEELLSFDFDAPLEESERDFYEDTAISIVTASPAEPVYIYFGHAGITVDSPRQDEIIFDYGTFRFDDSFYMNFILGRLYYSVISSYSRYRYSEFEQNDRTISKIELDLDPEAKKSVISFLSYNTQPENETYLYDYYLDNCATRLRDIYAAATSGDFKAWAEGIETGKSFRAFSTPYMSRSPFFAFVLNYLEGPSIDKPINLYEACFLPDVLMDAIEEYQGEECETLYLTQAREGVPETYSLTARAFPIAALLFLIVASTASKRRSVRRIGDVLSFASWLFMGVLSAILVFMMAATNHKVTYGNWNALIISPLVLVFAFTHLSSIIGKEHRKVSAHLGKLLFLAISLMLILKGCMMGKAPQDNLAFYIIALSGYGAEWAVRGLSSCHQRPRVHQGCAQDL